MVKLKNKLLLIFLTVFISFSMLYPASAKINYTKETINDVVAVELTIPAKYNITLYNPSIYEDTFEFITLIDTKLSPKQVVVQPKSYSSIDVTVLPNYRVKYDFYYEYFIRNSASDSIKDNMYVEIRPLSEILEISIPAEIGRNDASFPVKIKNKQNINLGEVRVFVESKPVASSSTISIPENSEKIADIPLADTRIKVTEAGTNDFKIILQLNNEYNYTVTRAVKLKEYSEIMEESKTSFQFFGYKKTITRKNNGNIPQVVAINYKYAHFLERAFTTFSIDPTEKTAEKATWQKQLGVGESYVIVSETNYTIPIIIIALIIIAIVAYVIIRRHKVLVSKKAIRVRTKGGEFAVKIILLLKNVSGHEVSNLNLVDRLPLTTQLYEKFGSVRPDQVDKHRLVWKFPALLPGEEIVTSYIIYSKIDMVGTIELPKASLTFNDLKGKGHTSSSNKLLVHAG